MDVLLDDEDAAVEASFTTVVICNSRISTGIKTSLMNNYGTDMDAAAVPPPLIKSLTAPMAAVAAAERLSVL